MLARCAVSAYASSSKGRVSILSVLAPKVRTFRANDACSNMPPTYKDHASNCFYNAAKQGS